MAFLRKEKKGESIYLSICESYRDAAGKPQRKVLRQLGNAADFSKDALERIGQQLIELAKGSTPEPQGLAEIGRYNYGFPLISSQLLKLYHLDVLLNRLTRKHKLSFSLSQNVQLMICDRFNNPMSKLASYYCQHDYIGIGDTIKLQHIYRTLDYLAINNDIIQAHIYNKNRNLFNYQLDVVFYDVTTFYFDSQVEEDSALRQLGFGKDGKVGQTQILFSLLIDKNKVPIGFEIFKGNQYEGNTFKNAIEKLKKKYSIKRIIVVADSGMLNTNNIALFDEGAVAEGFEYIVGDRIKNMEQSAINHLTNIKNYATTMVANQDGEAIPLLHCTYQYKGRTLISTYSERRAKKDKADREKKIAAAEKMIKQPSNLDKKASRYFIKNDGEKKYTLDQAKIIKQAKFDGFKVIATNAKDIGAAEALEKYKDLYKIEQSFRSFKSYFETRPMFHWTDKRIEGHIVLCYIAFCLLSYLQNKTGLTEQTIRRTLDKMQLSKIQKDKEILWLTAANNEDSLKLLTTLKIKPLPNVASENTIKKYISKAL
jgi:transposase